MEGEASVCVVVELRKMRKRMWVVVTEREVWKRGMERKWLCESVQRWDQELKEMGGWWVGGW